MLKTAIVIVAAGAAATMLVGFPVMSVVRSGSDSLLQAMGPNVNADVLRDDIAKAHRQLAMSSAGINTLERQITHLEREAAALDADIPNMEQRLRRMRATLQEAASSSGMVLVNGREHRRSEVESEVSEALLAYNDMKARRVQVATDLENTRDQVSRLQAERRQTWSTLAAMSRRVDALEAEAENAAARQLASSSITGLNMDRGLQRRMDQFERHVDAQRAMADGVSVKTPSAITWDFGEDLLARLDMQLGDREPGEVARAASHGPIAAGDSGR